MSSPNFRSWHHREQLRLQRDREHDAAWKRAQEWDRFDVFVLTVEAVLATIAAAGCAVVLWRAW